MSAEPVTIAPGPMVPAVYEVVTVVAETADTVTLELEPTVDAVPVPVPGQFNMLWVPGIGEVPISLAGIPGGHLVHTIRAVGAVTSALCAMRPGDQLGVRGPFGKGWGLERAVGRDILVVAGGLGLVPLRPLIHDVIENRREYGHVSVLVGARSPDGLVYGEEIDEWARSVDVAVTVDVAGPGWKGHVGAVTDLLPGARSRPGREVAFVCGPEIMMRVVAASVVERGTVDGDVLVSLERNMHCGIGHCGRCQLGSAFLCKDGPVVAWSETSPLLAVRGR